MKNMLKILFAPLMALYAVALGFLTFLVRVSGTVLAVAGYILAVLGLGVLSLDSVRNGVIILTMAFLIGPLGLPLLAALLIGQLYRLRYWMKEKIYG